MLENAYVITIYRDVGSPGKSREVVDGINNTKGSDIFSKKTYHSNQENHQFMPGAPPIWNDLHPNLL